MARQYEATSMEVLPKLDAHSDVVIKVFFTYGDSEASLTGQVKLAPPTPGSQFIPVESITKETALSWALDQCIVPTTQFDAQLDAEIARKANPPYIKDWRPEVVLPVSDCSDLPKDNV